jgi:tetratricopeptide (TPR) repeat protein
VEEPEVQNRKLKVHAVLISLLALVVVGCQSNKVAENPAARPSELGHSCAKTADCINGLVCVGQVCAAEEGKSIASATGQLVGSAAARYLAGAKINACSAQLMTLSSRLEMYLFRNDAYPETLDKLLEGKSPAKPKHLVDPWEHPLTYEVEGDTFKLCSTGPDGQYGTSDDICEPYDAATETERSEASGPRLLESSDDFDKRLLALAKQLPLRDGEKMETAEEMLWVLAWYQFLFADTFKVANGPDGKPIGDLYLRLRKSHAGQVFKTKLEAMDLAAATQWEEAANVFDEYLRLKSSKMAELLEKNKITAQVAREDNLLAAWFALESGKLDHAEALLKDLQVEKSGELYPSLLEVRTISGRAQAAEEAKDEATARAAEVRSLELLIALVEKYPRHVQSKSLLSSLYGKQREYDEAIALAGDCLEIGRERGDFGLQIDSYRALASYLQATERTDQLFTLLEQLKAEILGKKTGLPEPEDMLLLLCKLYLDRDMVGQALGGLELCGESCSSPEYFLLHARSYAEAGLRLTAIERAKEGQEKYPNDPDLLMLLAQLTKETGQSNSSVAYLEKILVLHPDNSKAALTLANLFLELQDPPNARKVLMEAERYVEDSLELQEMLAEVNEAMGDDQGTISALTKILELRGNAPKIRKKLAGYQVKQGNYQVALSHFEALEKQGRITSEVRQDYAKCLRATGRTQDALGILKELLRDDPGDVDTARFLADVYLQKEDYLNARLFLEAARRADNTDPEVHYLIGTTCLKLDDEGCAREAFQAFLKLAPANDSAVAEVKASLERL